MHAFATPDSGAFEVTAIDTPRLQLRAITLEDGPAVDAALWENREHLQPWVEVPAVEPSAVTTRRRIERLFASTAEGRRIHFVIRAHATGELLGLAAIAPVGSECVLSYWLVRAHTGQGYAREAVTALSRVAFGEANTRAVLIHCASLNLRSAAVARGAGFRRTTNTTGQETWTLTADRMLAWDAARAALRAARPESVGVLVDGDGLHGCLPRGGPFLIELAERDGDVQTVVTSEISDAGAFTAMECLEHNAALAFGALCVRGAKLLLRHACRPWELTAEHIEGIAREADRLRAVTHALQRAAAELDFLV